MSVFSKTRAAVKAAREAGVVEATDSGTVEVLYTLAKNIDGLEDGLTVDGKLDNVSIPTFLKYADALGLTPTARQRFKQTGKKQETPSVSVSENVVSLEAQRAKYRRG